MFGHTSDDMTLCGGNHTPDTCITFTSGQWVTSHALAEKRRWHNSWNNKEEGKIILLGGFDDYDRTDVATETILKGEYDGVSGFYMEPRTR